jgi:hypothetical protein
MNSLNSYNSNLNKGKVPLLSVLVAGNKITPNVVGSTYYFYVKTNTTFSINKSIPIDFTLVSGGGGCGTAITGNAGNGGGGGHVLNRYGYTYPANTPIFTKVGIGGTGIGQTFNTSTTNYNTIISNNLDTYISTSGTVETTINTTNFVSYGGGANNAGSGASYPAMGGGGSAGGLYNSSFPKIGIGGGGGGQTVITSAGTTNIPGNAGTGNTINSGGKGGDGQTGVDGMYYGGGGGGGSFTSGNTTSDGRGGNGGGQNGSYSNLAPLPSTNTRQTGYYKVNGVQVATRSGATGEQGGGAGGVHSDGTVYDNAIRGTVGAPGIIIVRFKYP